MPQAAESARSVSALAYTVGSHVVFGAGQYAPGHARGTAASWRMSWLTSCNKPVALRSAAQAATEHRMTAAQRQRRICLDRFIRCARGLIQRQPEPEPKLRDLPIFLEKLELDVGKIFSTTGIIYIKPQLCIPTSRKFYKTAFTRYALGLNVLKNSFRYAGFKPDTADKLALGTGILFKGLTFVREGEFVLDFQVDIGRGVKFETNIESGRESEGRYGCAQSRREYWARAAILTE